MATKEKKIKFQDYKNYPPEIMQACRFRDAYDDEPDGAFFGIAEEHSLYEALIAMAEWEDENTYHPGK